MAILDATLCTALIGYHGFLFISQLANKYIENPNNMVKLNQKVWVKVTDVDLDRKRISLMMQAEC